MISNANRYGLVKGNAQSDLLELAGWAKDADLKCHTRAARAHIELAIDELITAERAQLEATDRPDVTPENFSKT